MGVVVGFLIISFGIWGVGDMLRGYGRSTLAKVGSTEIGTEQFRQAFNDRLRLLGQRTNRSITPDQARALGLDRQLLKEMIAEAALDERVRQLKLNLSDEEVARQIRSDPNFRGANGQFDRFRFEAIIRNMGYTEARYVAEQRFTAMRRQLVDTISGQMIVPKTAADALNRYQNEERTIEYALLDRNAAGEIEAPSLEVLQKYFDEHKTLYRAPEYRKLVVLTVSPAELAPRIEISDADAKRHYDEHRERYGSPERRQVQQIVFTNAEEARAAAERITAGTPFATVATERGLKEQDIDLGLVTKSAIFDKAIADAAFSLAEGATSAPITGRFGPTLVHVVKIQPAQTKAFEEVAAEIKKDMALERAKPKVFDTHDKVEDERASGMHLDEIARKLNLPYRTIEAVDRSGLDPNGQPVADLPANLLSAAFSTDVGVEADPLQLPGGGFVWYDVAAVTPSRERALSEVKDKVETQWRDDQTAQRLAAKGAELVEKLKSEAPFADVASSVGATVQTIGGLKRGKPSGPVAAKAIDAVFRTPKGASGSAEGASSTERIVFRVTDITEPKFDAASADGKRQIEVLRRSLTEDIIGLYITRLENELGTSINEDALRRATGSGDQN
jgi:peptidyl-prolyl cis-trans isomerase D